MPRILAAVALAASLVACASLPKPPPKPVRMAPPPPPGQVDPSSQGEVVWKDLTGVAAPRRATYDATRISGPTVNLTRAAPDRWVGKFRGADAAVVTAPGKISGPGIDLSLTFDDKEAIVIEGLWGGRAVKMVLGKNSVTAALPGGTFDLTDMGEGMFNSYQGLLRVAGPPDMPQIAIAMLDVLSR